MKSSARDHIEAAPGLSRERRRIDLTVEDGARTALDEAEGSDSSRQPERELILASQSGDTEAFSVLYGKYRGYLYTICVRSLKDPFLAEDALHDAFLKAFVNLTKFQVDRPLAPWLASIARRHCIDIQRKRGRDPGLDEIDEDRVSPHLGPLDPFFDASFEQVMGTERLAKLRLALATLSPRQRRTLMLAAIEGWSYDAIASAEGCSNGAVTMMLVRARKKLREALERLGPLVVVPALLWRDRFRAAVTRSEIEIARRSHRAGTNVQADHWMVKTASVAMGVGLAFIVTIQSPVPDQPPQREPGLGQAAPAEIRGAEAAGARRRPVVDAGEKHEKPASPLIDIPGVTSKPTPENSSFYEMSVSPDYQNDHTLFASGYCPSVLTGACHVLFASRDGGASWEHVPARGFMGALGGLLLSPFFEDDHQMFAIGDGSIQRSVDAGDTFQPIAPIFVSGTTDNAASVYASRRETGSPRLIVVTDKAILEYSDRKLPSPLFYAPQDAYHGLGVSPAYPQDGVSLLLTRPRLGPDAARMRLSRCVRSFCREISLPTELTFIRGVRFSPTFASDGTVYVYGIDPLARGYLLVSTDGARSFRKLPWLGRDVTSMVVSRGVDGKPIVLVSAHAAEKPPADNRLIYRLTGEDRWDRLVVPGIEWPDLLAATPTGRVFVGGSAAWSSKGIACSDDGGSTWQTRCSAQG